MDSHTTTAGEPQPAIKAELATAWSEQLPSPPGALPGGLRRDQRFCSDGEGPQGSEVQRPAAVSVRTTYEGYLRALGWEWVPTMQIGSGYPAHVRTEELPKGRPVVRLSRHLTVIIDGVIHDIYNPNRERLATGTAPDSAKAKVWDAEAGRELLTLGRPHWNRKICWAELMPQTSS